MSERELNELRTALGALKQKEKGYLKKCQQLHESLLEIRRQQRDICVTVNEAMSKWSSNSQQMLAVVQKLGEESEKWRSLYFQECERRKRAHNKMMELRGNIRVFSRTRPMLERDLSAGAKMSAQFDPLDPGTLLAMSTNGNLKEYEFDHAFPPTATQEEVFEETSDVVVSVMDGYDVCIFAYGQTGTGKTHTMEGNQSQPGINFRTLEKLFQVKEDRKDQADYSVLMSVVEVYNEHIKDLLAPHEKDNKEQKSLEVKQQADGRHYVPGVVEQEVTSAVEAWEVLRTGASSRAVQSTKSNNQSSRSHCLVCVTVRCSKTAQHVQHSGTSALQGSQGPGSACTGTLSRLWLVDLAGSERVAKSGVTGDRLNETKSINSSLLFLGDVISSLSKKASFVNFRSSNLTKLLQDSLGGQAKVLMLVHVSPVDKDASETTASLMFASKARGVELGPAKRQADTSALRNMREQTEQVEQRAKQQKDELEEALVETKKNLELGRQKEAQAQKRVQELERMLVASGAGTSVLSAGLATAGSSEACRLGSSSKPGAGAPEKEALVNPEQMLTRTLSGSAYGRAFSRTASGSYIPAARGGTGPLVNKLSARTPSSSKHELQSQQAQHQGKNSPFVFQSTGALAFATPRPLAHRSSVDSVPRVRSSSRWRNSDIGLGGQWPSDSAVDRGFQRSVAIHFSPSVATNTQRASKHTQSQLSGMKQQRGVHSEWFESWNKRQKAGEGDKRFHPLKGFTGHTSSSDFATKLETVPEFHPGGTSVQHKGQGRSSSAVKPPPPRPGSASCRKHGGRVPLVPRPSNGFGIGASQSMVAAKDDTSAPGKVFRLSRDSGSFTSASGQSLIPSAAAAASQRNRRKSVASSNALSWRP